MRRRRRSLLFWLFAIPWRLACGIVNLFGRLGGIIIGMIVIILGLLLSFTIVGAIIGIPLMLMGILLLYCALSRRRRRPRR